MNNFDIKRLGRLMQYTFVSDRSVFVKLITIWTVVFFLLFMLTLNAIKIRMGGFAGTYEACLNNALGAANSVFIGFLMFEPCFIFSNLKRKQPRINFFMLPATNLEKYIARFLTVVFLWTLCCIIGFVAADLLQWLVSFLIHPEATGLVMSQISDLNILSTFSIHNSSMSGDLSKYSLITFIVVLILLFHSFCLLGGTFFRRHSWMLTVVLFIILNITLVATASNVLANINMQPLDPNVLFSILSAICVLFIMFNYWASYTIFRRMQIINNKWINL